MSEKKSSNYTWLFWILLTVFAVKRGHGQIVEGGPCTTLKKEPFICVPMKTCRTITDLFDTSPRPLPQWVIDQVRQSHCGAFNNIHHACCDPSNVTVAPPVPTPKFNIRGISSTKNVTRNSINQITEGGPCITLLKEPGICVPIKICRTITYLFDTSPRPLPDWVSDQVRQSHCGTFNNTHHACCDPNNVTVTVSTSKSIIRSGIVEKSKDELEAKIAKLQQTVCGMNDVNLLRMQDIDSLGEAAYYNARSNCLFISNGLYADLFEYPWMALLVYSDNINRTIDCGGSLIHERYVLTAAHCIHVQKKRLVSVRLGEHNTESDEDCTFDICTDVTRCAPPVQEIDVEEAIYHQAYNPRTFSDDVGIIRLTKNAVINTNVKPICLPVTLASKYFPSEKLTVSGWGRMENGNKATILQKAFVPIRTIDYCQQAHKLVRMNSKHLCAGGDNNIDTCKGDSGGPLFGYRNRRYIQYGIVSAGSMFCGSQNSPGIYASVESYLLWIVSNLNFLTDNSTGNVMDNKKSPEIDASKSL